MENANKNEIPGKNSKKVYLIVFLIVASLGLLGATYLFIENKKEDERLAALRQEQLALQLTERNALQAKTDSASQKTMEFERTLIKPAGAIKMKNISITALSLESGNKEKKTNMASKTKKLRIILSLKENSLAKTGIHDVYIRIMDDQNELVGSDISKTIDVVDDQLQYTSKTTINFTNADQPYTLEWINPGNLSKSTYDVTLYADGYFVGRGSVTLQ